MLDHCINKQQQAATLNLNLWILIPTWTSSSWRSDLVLHVFYTWSRIQWMKIFGWLRAAKYMHNQCAVLNKSKFIQAVSAISFSSSAFAKKTREPKKMNELIWLRCCSSWLLSFCLFILCASRFSRFTITGGVPVLHKYICVCCFLPPTIPDNLCKVILANEIEISSFYYYVVCLFLFNWSSSQTHLHSSGAHWTER